MKETSSSDQKITDLQRRPWTKPAAHLKVSHQRPQRTWHRKAQATSGAAHNERGLTRTFYTACTRPCGNSTVQENGCSRPAQGGADDTFLKANQSQYDLLLLPGGNDIWHRSRPRRCPNLAGFLRSPIAANAPQPILGCSPEHRCLPAPPCPQKQR